MHAPEERYRVERLVPSHHVAGCRLPLALSHDPVFDPNVFTEEKQPDEVRRAYVEVQLQSLIEQTRSGQCPAVIDRLDKLGNEDPNLAFLTIDSGFPLAELEAAFRAGKPFEYKVRGIDVPVLFGAGTWFDKGSDPLDQLLDGRDVARLYYAMTKLDTRTADTVFDLFERFVAQGKTMLMVTHDRDLASRASRVVLIADGEIMDDRAALSP